MGLTLQDRVNNDITILREMPRKANKRNIKADPSVKYLQMSRECAMAPRINPYCWINEKNACSHHGKFDNSTKKYYCSQAQAYAASSSIN